MIIEQRLKKFIPLFPKEFHYYDMFAPDEFGDIVVNYTDLTSLEGSPERVKGHFFCNYNELTSLIGGPKFVEGNFFCNGNKLSNLIGGPEWVDHDFFCNNNNLTSLEGAPTQVGGDFYCHNNTRQFTAKEVRAMCRVGGRIITRG